VRYIDCRIINSKDEVTKLFGDLAETMVKFTTEKRSVVFEDNHTVSLEHKPFYFEEWAYTDLLDTKNIKSSV